jgi:hypothetical protein
MNFYGGGTEVPLYKMSKIYGYDDPCFPVCDQGWCEATFCCLLFCPIGTLLVGCENALQCYQANGGIVPRYSGPCRYCCEKGNANYPCCCPRATPMNSDPVWCPAFCFRAYDSMTCFTKKDIEVPPQNAMPPVAPVPPADAITGASK